MMPPQAFAPGLETSRLLAHLGPALQQEGKFACNAVQKLGGPTFLAGAFELFLVQPIGETLLACMLVEQMQWQMLKPTAMKKQRFLCAASLLPPNIC